MTTQPTRANGAILDSIAYDDWRHLMKRYDTLRTVSIIMTITGTLVIVIGGLIGLSNAFYAPINGILEIVAAIVSGAFIIGIGATFSLLVDVAHNTQRTSDSLEIRRKTPR